MRAQLNLTDQLLHCQLKPHPQIIQDQENWQLHPYHTHVQITSHMEVLHLSQMGEEMTDDKCGSSIVQLPLNGRCHTQQLKHRDHFPITRNKSVKIITLFMYPFIELSIHPFIYPIYPFTLARLVDFLLIRMTWFNTWSIQILTITQEHSCLPLFSYIRNLNNHK